MAGQGTADEAVITSVEDVDIVWEAVAGADYVPPAGPSQTQVAWHEGRCADGVLHWPLRCGPAGILGVGQSPRDRLRPCCGRPCGDGY